MIRRDRKHVYCVVMVLFLYFHLPLFIKTRTRLQQETKDGVHALSILDSKSITLAGSLVCSSSRSEWCPFKCPRREPGNLEERETNLFVVPSPSIFNFFEAEFEIVKRGSTLYCFARPFSLEGIINKPVSFLL